MGLSVAKGVLTAPTAGGLPVSQAVTGLGFQVKALLLFASYQTAAGQANGPGRFSLGMATQDGGTVQQGYTTIFNPDNVATATMNVGTNTNAVLKGLTAPSTTTVGAEYIATCASLDSDGFTLSWTDLPASAIKVHYFALGGTDITAAKVVSSTLASNTTTNVTVGTGWGQPDLLFAMGSSGGFSFGDFAAAGNMFLGVASSNTVRQSATIWSEDAAPTENLVGSQRQKFIYTFRGSTAGGAAEANADLSAKGSWPTDGFQVSNSGATSGDSIILLALKGTFQTAIGTMTGSSTLNSTTDFAAGFTPAGALLWGLNQPATAADITADGTGVQWGAFGIGAYDGTNQGFAAYSSDLANTTISTGQSHSETRVWQDIDPATTGAPTLNGEAQASVSGTNLRATQTDADIVATRVRNILVLGAAGGGGPTQQEATGTAAVATTATGAATARSERTGAAAAAFGATAAATAQTTASGTAAVVITASATATTQAQASGTSAVTVGATGAATATSRPTGTAAVTVTASAAATARTERTGAVSVTVTAAGAATALTRATGTAAVTIGATGTATVPGQVSATGTAAIATTATGTATARTAATGTATVGTTAIGAARVTRQAAGQAAVSITASGTAATPSLVSAAGIAAITVSSVAAATVRAVAAGSAAIAFTATGDANIPGHEAVVFHPLPAGRIARGQPGPATQRGGGFIAGHAPGQPAGATPGELVGASRGRVHTSGVKP